MWFLILLAAIFLLWLFFKLFKLPKFGSLNMICGGVKTGKTQLCCYAAFRAYRRALIGNYIYNYFARFLPCIIAHKPGPKAEKPLFYSNIPVRHKYYVPLTKDLLLRKKRFVYKSVVMISEAALVADSQNFRDQDVNENLLLFAKLCAHETKGGSVYIETQNIADVHYNIKRSCSNFLYIHHQIKLPFFCVLYCREMIYTGEQETINTFDEDVEKTLLRVIVPKYIWKRYDRYCYSVLTDNLPVERNFTDNRTAHDLKAHEVLRIERSVKK